MNRVGTCRLSNPTVGLSFASAVSTFTSCAESGSTQLHTDSMLNTQNNLHKCPSNEGIKPSSSCCCCCLNFAPSKAVCVKVKRELQTELAGRLSTCSLLFVVSLKTSSSLATVTMGTLRGNNWKSEYWQQNASASVTITFTSYCDMSRMTKKSSNLVIDLPPLLSQIRTGKPKFGSVPSMRGFVCEKQVRQLLFIGFSY